MYVCTLGCFTCDTLQQKKIPTQHVTAGYPARPYPEGEPKKTSLGGPSRHLKFGQNLVLSIALLTGVNMIHRESFTLFQRQNGKSSSRCTDDPPTWGNWSCLTSSRETTFSSRPASPTLPPTTLQSGWFSGDGKDLLQNRW